MSPAQAKVLDYLRRGWRVVANRRPGSGRHTVRCIPATREVGDYASPATLAALERAGFVESVNNATEREWRLVKSERAHE